MSSNDASNEPRKLKRRQYEKELRKLQVELCRLQDWVVHKGLRVIIVFEGRDAAGKGGTIKAITERVSPRVFRLVVLPAPSDREKTQLYAQRYIQHFPAAGEIVVFDRSWYNRTGVEYVMEFCTKDQYKAFVENCPKFESHIVKSNIILIKFWLEVGQKEQQKRFSADRRPVAAVEAQSDGFGIMPTGTPTLAPGHDARCHRYRGRAVAHRPLRRQASGPLECIALS